MFQLHLAYVASLVLGMGPMGVFLAITLAEVLLSLLAIRAFRSGKWKDTRV